MSSENAGLCDVCGAMKNNLRTCDHTTLGLDWKYRACAMCQSYFALPLTDVLIAYVKFQQRMDAGDPGLSAPTYLRVRWQGLMVFANDKYENFTAWRVNKPDDFAERVRNIEIQLAMLDDKDESDIEETE